MQYLTNHAEEKSYSTKRSCQIQKLVSKTDNDTGKSFLKELKKI